MAKRKLLLLPVFLFPLVVILSQCLSTKEVQDPRGEAYAGAKTCISCHKDISNSYPHMAHYIASSPATTKTVHGNFLPGLNSFTYNDHTKIVMTKTDSGLYQTNYVNGQRVETARRE
jgi:hypothetical protein